MSFFFFENAQNLTRSDDAKRRKRGMVQQSLLKLTHFFCNFLKNK